MSARQAVDVARFWAPLDQVLPFFPCGLKTPSYLRPHGA